MKNQSFRWVLPACFVLFAVPNLAFSQGALDRLGNLLDRLESRVQPDAPANLRPYLGAVLDEPKNTIGLAAGVVVVEVNPGGPAEAAGLREGDLVTKIDSLPVSTLERVSQVLATKKPYELLDIEVNRNGLAKSLSVQLTTEPTRAELPRPTPPPTAPADNRPRKLGIRVIGMTDALRVQSGTTVRRGAFVESVTPGGVGDVAGIIAGSVIVSFNGRRVDGPQDLISLVNDSPWETPVPVNFYVGNQIQNGNVVFGGSSQLPSPLPVPPASSTNPLPQPNELEMMRKRIESLEIEVRQLREEVNKLRNTDL